MRTGVAGPQLSSTVRQHRESLYVTTPITAMSSPLVEGWLFTTIPIQNPAGGSGTGFLVSRDVGEGNVRVFLVTNKHVVHTDFAELENVDHVICHFNTRKPDGSSGKAAGKVPLAHDDGSKRFRAHSDPDTDVLAINVTDIVSLNPEIEKKFAGYDVFADQAKRAELDITAGEDVVAIGYPLGMRQGQTNFPLLRQGLIATKIGYPIFDRVARPDGSYRDRTLRAFLVDGAFVPGSSGSPIVLKPVVGRHVHNRIVMGTAPPVLLGILAETTYVPIQVGQATLPTLAGLGLVFDVETIRETIELFFDDGGTGPAA